MLLYTLQLTNYWRLDRRVAWWTLHLSLFLVARIPPCTSLLYMPPVRPCTRRRNPAFQHSAGVTYRNWRPSTSLLLRGLCFVSRLQVQLHLLNTAVTVQRPFTSANEYQQATIQGYWPQLSCNSAILTQPWLTVPSRVAQRASLPLMHYGKMVGTHIVTESTRGDERGVEIICKSRLHIYELHWVA